MNRIEKYEARYENEGELLEDFPTAKDISLVYYDPVKEISIFRFTLNIPVYKPAIQAKCAPEEA